MLPMSSVGVVGQQKGPKPYEAGLTLWWDPNDETSYPGSGTTVYDLSGNSNNGTMNGTVDYVSGSPSYFYIGNGEYILTSAVSTLGLYNSSYTVAAFVYYTTNSGDNFLFGTNQSGTRLGMHHGRRGASNYFAHYSSDWNIGGDVPLNSWVFQAFAFNISNDSAYYWHNGAYYSQNSGPASLLSTGSVWIGQGYTSGGGYLDGRIGATFIWNDFIDTSGVSETFESYRTYYGL